MSLVTAGAMMSRLEHAGKPFAEMTDDDLQLWKAVEYAAEDEANDVNRGFDVPAPAGA